MNNRPARRTPFIVAMTMALTAAPMMTVLGYGHGGWHLADITHFVRRPMGGPDYRDRVGGYGGPRFTDSGPDFGDHRGFADRGRWSGRHFHVGHYYALPGPLFGPIYFGGLLPRTFREGPDQIVDYPACDLYPSPPGSGGVR